MSNYAEQITQMQQARTPEELQTIVQAHGGTAKSGIMTDAEAEAEAMSAAVRLYQAKGLGYNHAAQAAELLFYAKANSMWSKLIAAEAEKTNAAIMEAARRKEAEPDIRSIDPVKLKAAAERLEWVLRQYPNEPDVQGMLDGLLPLIEDAKAGRVLEPVDWIPFGYNFADGRYRSYEKPSVEDAYVEFKIQMRGGLTEEEKQLNARIEQIQNNIKAGQES